MGFLDRVKAAISKPETLPSPPPTTPATVVDDQDLLDRYYRSMDRLERAESKGAFAEALQIALETCEKLAVLVDACGAEEFDLQAGLPAVEFLCRLAPARLDAALLEQAEAAVRQRPGLAPWLGEIEAARARLTLAARIFEVLYETPGTKQASLARALGADGDEVREIMHLAEADGRVTRTKSGSTYELWLSGQRPPMEALPGSMPSATPPARKRRAAVQRPLPIPPGEGLVESLTTGRFAAIDFETATFERASACAVSVALVDDGRIGGTSTWLIQPPGNRYEGWNTMLHGIGPEDTAGKPGFSEVFMEVLAFVGERTVVAHYAPFDFGVIRAEHLRLGRPWPAMTVACSVVMSRRAWPGLVSYSLPMVADFLDLDPFTHHDPTADAKTCAEIVRRVLVATEMDGLDGVARALGIGLGHLKPEAYNPCLARFSGRWEFERPDPGDLDPDHPFADADLAFTGTLLSMTRREAAQLVVDAGGRFSENVSGKTEFLIFGEQDFTKFVDGERSGKTRKAEELLASGHHIQIISEGDFLQMLEKVNPHNVPCAG